MATLHGSVKKMEKVRKVMRGSHLTKLDLAQLINMKKSEKPQESGSSWKFIFPLKGALMGQANEGPPLKGGPSWAIVL